MPSVFVTGDAYRRYEKVAAVEHNGEWKFFLPFRRDSIEHAALVGDDLLICLSNKGELRLINWRTDQEVARREVARYHGEMLVTADQQFIILSQHNRYRERDFWPGFLHIIRVQDLKTIAEGNGLLWDNAQRTATLVNIDYPRPTGPDAPVFIKILTPVTEDKLGRLTFTCALVGPPGSSRYGICQINRADWSMDFQPIPETSGRWIWFSPRGKLAIAKQFQRLLYDNGLPRRSLLPSFKKDNRHRDVRLDGMARFGRPLELWETDPPKLKSIILDRLQSLKEGQISKQELDWWIERAKSTSDRPLPVRAPDWRPTNNEIDAEPEMWFWRNIPIQDIKDIVWEPDEGAFWIHYEDYKREYAAFRRVGLNGSLSPLFCFARFNGPKFKHSYQEIIDTTLPQEVQIQAGTSGDSVAYIKRSWCERPNSVILISEDDDGFRQIPVPGPNERAVMRVLGKCGRHVVRVAEFTEPAIVDALEKIARDIRERLSELIIDETFELSFKIGDKTASEVNFFKRIAAENMPIAPVLRDLLKAYLDTQPDPLESKGAQTQIWGPQDRGALGPAMEALLKIEPGAHDLFREYLAKRDGEHETYSTDVMMKNFVKDNGWKNEAMIRFGIYFALIRQRDGRSANPGGLLNEYGLITTVKKTMKADEFAALILEEINHFVMKFGWDDAGRVALHQAIGVSLEVGEYGRRVLRAITERSEQSKEN